MRQTFEKSSTEELPIYSDYVTQIGTKSIVAFEGVISNILSSSLTHIDKKELILKMKQAAERALLLDL